MSVWDDELDERLRYTHTTLLGRVAAVNATSQTVDVEVLTKRPVAVEGGVVYRAINNLNDVPLATFRTSRASDIVDVVAGDLVLVLFLMYDSAHVITSNGECGVVAPDLVETHGLGSAIALPIQFASRPATSSGADREIISDDVRIGRPTSAAAVVLAGLQGVLDTLVVDLNAALAEAAGGTPPASVVMGTIPTSSHVRVS